MALFYGTLYKKNQKNNISSCWIIITFRSYYDTYLVFPSNNTKQTRMTSFPAKRLSEYQWTLALMLLTLHGVLVMDPGSALQKAMLVAHYGFFLMWQPIWQTNEKISYPALLLFLVGGFSFVTFANWWMIAFWIAGLFGLMGGRVFSSQAKSTRLGYLFAANYLLAILLLWMVPKLLESKSDLAAAEFVTRYLLPFLPIMTMFTRSDADDGRDVPVVDFFYALLLLLMAVILILGSFAIGSAQQIDYFHILIKVVFLLAFALLVISWLWNPRAGYVGIGQLLSRYLLSVGLPFEQWVRNISLLAERESSPREFTKSAMQELASLSWVKGVIWDTHDGRGEIGTIAEHHATLGFGDFHLTLYTRWPLTPALTMHVKMLTRIIGEFYVAKRREELMRQNAYMQAVYETGARLTHDIKNIVQSLGALCSAAELTMEEDNERLLALVRRQLPQLNQRLALTISKLGAPKNEVMRHQNLPDWWNTLKLRHNEDTIEFQAGEIHAMEIDADVLDSVTENLLQNALEKLKSNPQIKIKVTIQGSDNFYLEVSDTGHAMPLAIAEQLFKKHVSSENGLGIGLYHAARQAREAGYLLSLAENRDGAVRFSLTQSL